MSGLAEVLRRSAAHVLVEPGSLEGDRLPLDPDTEHHLARVLRLRDDDSVTATDGAGAWRPWRVARVGDALDLVGDGEIAFEPEPTPRITIATAIPKGDRIDWLTQKVTECGVDRLVLMHCERSVVHWKPGRAERQLVRLQRIADEALRQSRRVWRLEVVGPVPASEVLPHAAGAEPGGDRLDARHQTVAIGPEGGWTATERGMMSLSVDLGPHVLRTETAAVVAATRCVAVHR